MNRETRLLGWHYEWTAGQLTSLGSLFILLLAPLLSWLWPWLARRGLNPSKPRKSALGLMVAGLAFLLLEIGRASWRDRVCTDVSVGGVGVDLKKKTK